MVSQPKERVRRLCVCVCVRVALHRPQCSDSRIAFVGGGVLAQRVLGPQTHGAPGEEELLRQRGKPVPPDREAGAALRVVPAAQQRRCV